MKKPRKRSEPATPQEDECEHEWHEDPTKDGVDVCIHCGEEDG